MRSLLLMNHHAEVSDEVEKERERRLATLGEALTELAHELKNPLTVILASGELAINAPNPTREQLLDILNGIREQGERMQSLIEELLGHSRPDDVDHDLDLAQLLRRLLRLEGMVRGHRVHWDDQIRLDGTVCLPGARVEQIVTNLLSNAAEAMRD